MLIAVPACGDKFFERALVKLRDRIVTVCGVYVHALFYVEVIYCALMKFPCYRNRVFWGEIDCWGCGSDFLHIFASGCCFSELSMSSVVNVFG